MNERARAGNASAQVALGKYVQEHGEEMTHQELWDLQWVQGDTEMWLLPLGIATYLFKLAASQNDPEGIRLYEECLAERITTQKP
jgi:hypothetical protein